MEGIGNLIKQRVERVIIENEMLRAGFAALPYVVLRDTRLSIGARLTYAVLLSYAWQDDSTFVGQAKMAKDMGISERQVQQAIIAARSHRTTILVAHRLSTLRDADRILVFDAPPLTTISRPRACLCVCRVGQGNFSPQSSGPFS